MQLPIISATLFISGILLSLNPVAPAAQSLAEAEFLRPEFSLGELSLNTQAEAEEAVEEVSEETKEQPEDVEKKEVTKPKQVYVVVKKGDTLSKIAKAHGTTYKRIFDANASLENPDVLNVGFKLRIPNSGEKLANREIPKSAPIVASTTKTNYSQPVASNAPAVASGSVWDRLAACESGGNWAINTGNGYYGGLQFLPSTWRGVGGTGLPHQHSREEQIKRAEILLARSGWGQWPQCARKIGML